MYMIEITEQKLNKATDYAEKMLKYGGMLMQCLTEWEEENGMGERGGMGYRSGESGGYSRSMMGQHGDYRNHGSRGGYGNRMNYRDEEEDDWEEMGERRGVRGSGRGRRY
jgi:hypothetical protein